mmetsp:Transcript_24522/g.53358  ORF Transcript_24522/g.53358 Transcript_24522/m.53358 type:complete len:235 (+) Transcript_24522:575-1279(+)
MSHPVYRAGTLPATRARHVEIGLRGQVRQIDPLAKHRFFTTTPASDSVKALHVLLWRCPSALADDRVDGLCPSAMPHVSLQYFLVQPLFVRIACSNNVGRVAHQSLTSLMIFNGSSLLQLQLCPVVAISSPELRMHNHLHFFDKCPQCRRVFLVTGLHRRWGPAIHCFVHPPANLVNKHRIICVVPVKSVELLCARKKLRIRFPIVWNFPEIQPFGPCVRELHLHWIAVLDFYA